MSAKTESLDRAVSAGAWRYWRIKPLPHTADTAICQDIAALEAGALAEINNKLNSAGYRHSLCVVAMCKDGQDND